MTSNSKKPVAKVAGAAAKTAKAAKQPAPAAKRRASNLSRDRILAVATGLFAERGYAAISIRDIAGACGIGIPSIYHFFGDKDSLYVSCCEQVFCEVEARLCASFDAGSSSRTHIRNFTIALCDTLLKNHNFRRLSQMEVLQDEHRSLEEITAPHFMSPFKLLVRDIGDLIGEKPAAERALLINTLVYGQIHLQRIAQIAGADMTRVSDPVKLAESVLNVALPGLDWTR